MKIRRAALLAYRGKKVRRSDWNDGVYCVVVDSDIVFYHGTGRLEASYYLNVDDLLADDWMEVWSEVK